MGCTCDADCDDGDICTTEWCEVKWGKCYYPEVPGCRDAECWIDQDEQETCNDHDPCTIDKCVYANKHDVFGDCSHNYVAGCDHAECKYNSDCEDWNPCTIDRCAFGKCDNEKIPDCGELSAKCIDGQYFCPWDNTCVDSCWFCHDSMYAVEAGMAKAWKSNPAFCRADCGPDMFLCPTTKRCVNDCIDQCDEEHTAPQTIGKHVCTAAGPKRCMHSELFYCPANNQCVKGCSACPGLNAANFEAVCMEASESKAENDDDDDETELPSGVDDIPCFAEGGFYCAPLDKHVANCCEDCIGYHMIDNPDTCSCDAGMDVWSSIRDTLSGKNDYTIFNSLVAHLTVGAKTLHPLPLRDQLRADPLKPTTPQPIKRALVDQDTLPRCGVTVLAPKNSAFDNLPDGTKAALWADRALLYDWMLLHIVPGGPRTVEELADAGVLDSALAVGVVRDEVKAQSLKFTTKVNLDDDDGRPDIIGPGLEFVSDWSWAGADYVPGGENHKCDGESMWHGIDNVLVPAGCWDGEGFRPETWQTANSQVRAAPWFFGDGAEPESKKSKHSVLSNNKHHNHKGKRTMHTQGIALSCQPRQPCEHGSDASFTCSNGELCVKAPLAMDNGAKNCQCNYQNRHLWHPEWGCPCLAYCAPPEKLSIAKIASYHEFDPNMPLKCCIDGDLSTECTSRWQDCDEIRPLVTCTHPNGPGTPEVVCNHDLDDADDASPKGGEFCEWGLWISVMLPYSARVTSVRLYGSDYDFLDWNPGVDIFVGQTPGPWGAAKGGHNNGDGRAPRHNGIKAGLKIHDTDGPWELAPHEHFFTEHKFKRNCFTDGQLPPAGGFRDYDCRNPIKGNWITIRVPWSYTRDADDKPGRYRDEAVLSFAEIEVFGAIPGGAPDGWGPKQRKKEGPFTRLRNWDTDQPWDLPGKQNYHDKPNFWFDPREYPGDGLDWKGWKDNLSWD
eukprot:TRINITY_DN53571_c0_g1_i1.p1 TRINITY_DN53571_c0_g1~~TRINITY_DN53571_c0_g1_i1.p1  ORF type:complete len:1080 (-),score=127.69 TRINITY_DN53571_c0_g1_i1:51-2900(-)